MHSKRGLLAAAFLSLVFSQGAFAQIDSLTGQDKFRAITTAVPFLIIVPDARTSGVGDAGTSLSPDANAVQYNTAKLAFAEKPIAASLSVSPWLRNIGVTDMYISLLSGYYKISKQDAVTLGFTYFNLGSLTFTTESGTVIRDFNPQEFALAGGYARQLTQKFSVGVNAKWIYSNLTGGVSNQTNTQSRPGQTAAVDISAFYKTDFALGGSEAQYVFAGSLNNFGPKISYTSNQRRDFIPTILRIGQNLTYNVDPYNKLTFMLDLTKLAVPTPDPARRNQYTGVDTLEKNLLNGFFSSFTDAPDGLSEELSEIMVGGGVEYWYDNLLALRGGYFNESKNKGGRKYFTVGAGLRYQQFGFDVSYLVPSTGGSNNPLANQLRFTLLFDFNKPADKAEESVTD